MSGRPAAGSRRAIASAAFGGKIGSESPKQTNAGPVHPVSASRVATISFAPASSSVRGTSSGNIAAPVLASGVSNGASYAAITSGGRSVAVPDCSTKPTGRSRPVRSANSRHRRNAGVGHRSLGATIPVFRTTSRDTRSGCSTANRRPIGPPQSCTTSVMFERSSTFTSAAIEATCISYV